MGIGINLRAYQRVFDTRTGPLLAVDEVDLDIAPGEFVALVGPSGCGKSTILRGVAGLDLEHGGSIHVDGTPVAGPDTSRGLVFQEPRLFPWLTVTRNIGLGLTGPARARAARVRELIELIGLAGFEQTYPAQLSGGMAQRVALARALAPQPGVLLLDEPFGALDAFTRMRLQDALHELWASLGTTVLLVTHDIDEAVVLAQRVAVMSDRPGRITEVVDVDLAYPRDRAGDGFASYRSRILRTFARGGAVAAVS